MNRSFLFVPADSDRKLAKAESAGADALILDLEDSVAAAARPAARVNAAKYLEGKDNVWVRINPLDGEDAIADLEAVMPSAPAGIVLPKPRSAADAIGLSRQLDRSVLHAPQFGLEQLHLTGRLPQFDFTNRLICFELPQFILLFLQSGEIRKVS